MMTSKRSTEVIVSVIAGGLAVAAFTVGQLHHDAIFRAVSTGLLVLCFSSALRAVRRRRRPEELASQPS